MDHLRYNAKKNRLWNLLQSRARNRFCWIAHQIAAYCFKPRFAKWAREKPSYFPLNPGCSIGILIVVDDNPYIAGWYIHSLIYPQRKKAMTGWWLNQSIWKICSTKWVHLPPRFGMNIKNIWNHQVDDNCLKKKTNKELVWKFLGIFLSQ